MSKKDRCTAVALPPQGQVLLWASLALQTAPCSCRTRRRSCLPGYPRDRLDVLPYPPGILARGPWPPDRVPSRWSDDPTSRPPEQGRRGRPRRSPSSQDRGRRRTTGWPPGWPASGGRRRAASSSCSRCAGRCGCWRRRVRRALGAVRRARRRGPLARRPARRVGGDAGPGVWALGAGGAVEVGRGPGARARRASSRRSGRVEPERLAVEALVATARRHGDADRPGLARARRGGDAATTSTTRTRGGRPTPTTGPTRHIRNCGGWPLLAMDSP